MLFWIPGHYFISCNLQIVRSHARCLLPHG